MFDPQALLDRGTHRYCDGCGYMIPTAAACRRCAYTHTHTPGAPARPTPPTKAGTLTLLQRRGYASDDDHGGLALLPGRTLRFVVHGRPIPQGSQRAVAVGVTKPDNPHLKAWRDTITRAAFLACGQRWGMIQTAVRLDVAATIPAPRHLAAGERLLAVTTPDGDKLLRAVQDALSPKVRQGQPRFQVISDDSLIIDTRLVKTYPGPNATHAWALDHPGVVIQISALERSNAAPMPSCTLNGALATPDWLPKLLTPAGI